MKLKFLIAAQVYSPASGGIMVLHELCDTLNRIGHDAALIIFHGSNDQEQKWLWGVSDSSELYHPDHSRVSLVTENHGVLVRDFIENGIVVYPDLIQGNPLGAPRVVRYLLNKNASYQKSSLAEFVLSFSRIYHGAADAYLFKSFPHSGLNAEGSLHWAQRTLDITYIGKGHNFLPCFRVPGTLLITRNWPEDKVQLGILLRQCRYFFSWDGASQTNLDALKCGAVPIILHEKQLTGEDYRESELGPFPAVEFADPTNKDSVICDIKTVDQESLQLLEKERYYIDSWDSRVLQFTECVGEYFLKRDCTK